MRKLCAAILSAAICLSVSGAPAWASEHQSTLSAGYLHARTNAPGSDNLNGINVKYRYEFTDALGLITSFSYANGDYLRVTDNKGKTHDVLTGSDDGRHSNTSLAWGAGVQFNPTESVTIDLAYEGSGSGDWRTDAFIVGIGYRF
ncbi:MAG: Ail/Lom family outer membrane beta-barrel protein [Escherichia coli]|nr:Ail/Lom family outer membrane beta-barrel protein [Escherichia coli]